MDKVENNSMETEAVKPSVWLRYIDDIFFIWNESEEKLEEFLEKLKNFIHIWNLQVKNLVNIESQLIAINFLILALRILSI